MALALTGDTWGISGPTFLTAYLLLAAAVWLAGTMTRRRLTDPRPDRPIGELDARPHDVAHLHGGPDLAVTSALSSMHLTGTVAPVAGQIQAVGRLGPGADALERAVHFATGSPVRRQRLPFHGTVRTALDGIEQRLVAAGLLLSPDDRRRIRGVGWWLVGVAALGLVRLLAGLSEARPIGFLTAATIAVAVVAGVQLSWAPRRTRSGDRALAQLRSRHHDLDPESRPDRVAYGPAAVALGVGLFGASALWASDPAFASEIELQRATAGGGDSGFVGGGGDSGGGGGDGGGGGGCGGGGGGCGG